LIKRALEVEGIGPSKPLSSHEIMHALQPRLHKLRERVGHVWNKFKALNKLDRDESSHTKLR